MLYILLYIMYYISHIIYHILRLPHCRCMVSHGGAGVLHSSLRAGIPCVIAPLMGDQFFHAKLVEAKAISYTIGIL